MPSSRAESINCRSVLADRNFVPDDQIEIFCQILQFRHEYGERYDTEEGRTIYYNRLRPLLPKLKFPLSSNPGLAWKLILPKQSEYTYLCDMHKGLNADFVHQWFKFLALEVGARLELLRSSHRDYIGQNAWDNIIKPLTRLHKIWETQSRVEGAFGDFTEVGFSGVKDLISAERQSDGCEACILARIGSHAPTLFALRAAIKSRISLESSARHPNRLRLLRLIEPWIQCWQARSDYKCNEQATRIQHLRENTRLADELYCKRKRLEIFQHELKYAHIQQVQDSDPDKRDQETQDIFYQAENDIIDSYAALRATQRESQSIRSSLSRSQKHESTSMLSGESPYRYTGDPAYHESRYSIDTANNNERVIWGSQAVAADHMVPRRAPQTYSTQTTWGDVIGLGGSLAGNPYNSAASSTLARVPERHSGQSFLQSERGSIRKPVREDIPPVESDVRRHSSVKSVKHNDSDHRDRDGIHDSMDIFDYKKYNTSSASGAGSLVSPLRSMYLSDRHNGRRSAVSSMSSREISRHRQERSRHQHRNSRDSAWTDASLPAVDARLSRPFEQPAYEITAKERLAQRERRR